MSAPPQPVRSRFIRIPLADGRRLAARLIRPVGGPPTPALLDASPYRAFDLMRSLGEGMLRRFAEHGYAVLALETRGSGGSDGLLKDEYLAGEIDDALAAVRWLKAQPWCAGAVGVSGLSWAGFTALRAAAKAPGEIAAMVLGGVSEDGWRTDIHNLGGAPYAARVDWAGTMQLFNALPPDPRQFGAAWREAWLERLAANRPWISTWLAHPGRDAFWREKAVAPGAVSTPLLLYSGLADKYAASVLRIASGWAGPVRTIIGPWGHQVPDFAARRPRIDFLAEALRWWDHWLKGRATGVMAEPPLRLWLGEPDREGRTARGHWIGCPWPRASEPSWSLAIDGRGALVSSSGIAGDPLALTPAPATPPALAADLYEDQPAPFDLAAAARAGAVVATTAPAAHDLDIMPGARLVGRRLAGEGGQIAARLFDIAPEGAAVRMAIGAANLALSGPEVEIDFQACAWRLKAGHRLGLMLAAEAWPTLWPAPRPAPVSLAGLVLTVPLARLDETEHTFRAPERTRPQGVGKLRRLDPAAWPVPAPALAGGVSRESVIAAHHLRATGADYLGTSRFELALAPGGQAAAAKASVFALERGDWRPAVETSLVVRSRPDAFTVAWGLKAFEAGEPVFAANGEDLIPRTIA